MHTHPFRGGYRQAKATVLPPPCPSPPPPVLLLLLPPLLPPLPSSAARKALRYAWCSAFSADVLCVFFLGG